MPDPTPVEELQTAVERLRYLLHPNGMPEQIRANWTALPPPAQQGVVTVPGQEHPVLMAFWGGVAEYLVAVQPAVGAALANWLEWTIRAVDGANIAIPAEALAVARQINAGRRS